MLLLHQGELRHSPEIVLQVSWYFRLVQPAMLRAIPVLVEFWRQCRGCSIEKFWLLLR